MPLQNFKLNRVNVSSLKNFEKYTYFLYLFRKLVKFCTGITMHHIMTVGDIIVISQKEEPNCMLKS